MAVSNFSFQETALPIATTICSAISLIPSPVTKLVGPLALRLINGSYLVYKTSDLCSKQEQETMDLSMVTTGIQIFGTSIGILGILFSYAPLTLISFGIDILVQLIDIISSSLKSFDANIIYKFLTIIVESFVIAAFITGNTYLFVPALLLSFGLYTTIAVLSIKKNPSAQGITKGICYFLLALISAMPMIGHVDYHYNSLSNNTYYRVYRWSDPVGTISPTNPSITTNAPELYSRHFERFFCGMDLYSTSTSYPDSWNYSLSLPSETPPMILTNPSWLTVNNFPFISGTTMQSVIDEKIV
jgi:hypothetical protein